jgi:O-antigen/teichoic acid export membrane protein
MPLVSTYQLPHKPAGICLKHAFNYIGLKLFGYMGAAIGTAVTYTCIFLTTQRILHKKFGVRVWQVFINTFMFYGVLLGMARSYTTRLSLVRKHKQTHRRYGVLKKF